ncbi:hypothetical protein LL965_04775 [Xanthomonas cassavae CFBP 4642]|uniref:Uncharacterized protein n=1 Tax=Xanthomonas cassavae CFBP 4642 TaxID=1219375 RepID=A0ABS8HB79_9XANT|nr:hypothetical protein [Xanthomonas cassavae CFBP 4642]
MNRIVKAHSSGTSQCAERAWMRGTLSIMITPTLARMAATSIRSKLREGRVSCR